MKLERFRNREIRAPWRTDMSSHTDGESASAVGSLLRASRLRCGEELADVAQQLRIRQPYLQALEEGRFKDLPGPAYAVGFVRTYAEHLGLAGEEIVRRFKSEAAGISRTSELVFPSPVPEGGIPGGAILLVSVLLAGLAYGGWYMLSTKDRTVAEIVPALPDRLVELVEKVRGGFEPTPPPPARPDEGANAPGPQNTVPTTIPRAPAALLIAPIPSPENEVTAEATVAEAVATSDLVAGITGIPTADTEAPVSADIAAPVVAPHVVQQEAPPLSEIIPAGVDDLSSVSRAPEPVVTDTPVIVPSPEPLSQSPATALPVEDTGGQILTPAPIEASQAAEPNGPLSAQAAEIPVPPMAEPIAAEAVQLVAAPETAGAAAFAGTPANGGHIIVRAKTDSWVQVRDGDDNRLLLTRLMRAGDTYDVPNKPGLKLLTGNAGALEITIDGKLAPPIGPVGAVRRDVALDADKLLEGTATPQ